MTNFKRTMVALDLSEMDQSILAYTQFMTSIFGTKQLYLTHIIPSFTSIKNLDVEFQKLFAPEYPIDEKIKDRIQEKASGLFKEYAGGMDVKVEVIEGTIYKTLLHWTELKVVDLLVVGKKLTSENSGVEAFRVARNAKTSVLFVAKNASTTPQHIVVPMDYSDYSLRALEAALHIKRKRPAIKITCLSVIEFPPSIYGMTQSFVELTDVMRENIAVTHQQFLKTNNIAEDAVDLAIVKNKMSNTANIIRLYAEKNGADLIIMGAKGHTAFENLLYGSTTERLVTYEDKIPVLVVR